MAFIPVPYAVRVFLGFTLNGVPDKGYVLHFDKIEHTGVVLISELEALATAMVSWIDESLAPSHADNWIAKFLKLRSLHTESSPAYDLAIVPQIVGSASTESTAGQVCLAVKKLTADGSAAGRGRTFQTAIPRAAITDNTVASTHIALVLYAWDDLSGYASGAGFAPCVVSYVADGVPRAAGLVNRIVSYTVTDAKVDTQRRRLK